MHETLQADCPLSKDAVIQTDRQTDRQTDKETDREIERERERDRDTEITCDEEQYHSFYFTGPRGKVGRGYGGEKIK